MARTTGDFTVSQLERLLQNKKSRLQDLAKQRIKLVRDLQRVDGEIAAVEGRATRGAGTSIRRRPKNEKPLLAYINDVLNRNKDGVPLQSLQQKVLAAGYKTNSTNFKNVIYQSLYHDETIMHDETTGKYRRKAR